MIPGALYFYCIANPSGKSDDSPGHLYNCLDEDNELTKPVQTITIHNGDALIFVKKRLPGRDVQDRSYDDTIYPLIFWIGGAFVAVYPANYRVA